MKKLYLFYLVFIVIACKETKSLTANEIVYRAIEVSGGHLYETSTISFEFRDRLYVSKNKGFIQERTFKSDSLNYTDIKTNDEFQRFINDIPVTVSDSLARLYSNSINSVHYFAQLPYRLYDTSVNKELIGEQSIGSNSYFVVKVTFNKKNGGDDFEDTYVYWFNKVTFKPDYLAYDYHTDGGGVRFRKAYNERYVNGIRFVDYENYKPKDTTVTLTNILDYFLDDKLELLSKIELKHIEVTLEN